MTATVSAEARTAIIPGPDHPITLEHPRERIVVTAAGHVIAHTTHAVELHEAQYPPVFYVPRKDVDMASLERSDHTTYCPYKGTCSYYSIKGSARGQNAVWTYETPYDSVAGIKDHMAFYPDRVDSIEVR
jgi:uncharacterized protein (DUF427 family)